MPTPFSAAPPILPTPPQRYDPEEQAQFRRELERSIRATKENNEYAALYAEIFDAGGAVFNVKHPKFGAKGDGTIDDLTALNDAVTAAPSTGAIIFLPPGTYRTSNPWVISKSGIHIIGAGRGTTIIKYLDDVITTGDTLPVVDFDEVSGGLVDVGISDLTIDGNRSGQTLFTESAAGLLFRTKGPRILERCHATRLHVKNTSGDGITIEGRGDLTPFNVPEHVLIEDCIIEDPNVLGGGFNARQGIAVIGGKNIRIIGNSFRTIPAIAIDLEPDASKSQVINRVSILGNTVEDSIEGIFVTSATATDVSDIIVVGNSIKSSGNGIRVRADGGNVLRMAIGVNAYDAVTNITSVEQSGGTISWLSELFKASGTLAAPTVEGDLSFTAPSRAVFLDSQDKPVMYTANATFEGESGMSGALIIQPRGESGAERPVVIATGDTAAERVRFSENGFRIGKDGADINKHLTATATLDFDLTSIVSQDLTITVTGAALGDTVNLGVPNAAVSADTAFFAWVSATNTVTVRAFRLAGTPNPGSGAFRVDVWQH